MPSEVTVFLPDGSARSVPLGRASRRHDDRGSRRGERARRAPKLQLYLPGIEAPIPRSVPQAEGSARCPLLKATYEDLRRYRQQLQVKARQPSPRILQIKELMKLMRKHPTHGITVGEVLDLEGIQPKLPD